MDYSVQQLPDATLIDIKGRIDHKSAKDFEEALKSHLGEDQTGALVLDLEELEYMTSAGLRVLMIAAKTLAGQQRKLAVAALQPLIAEIFKISRFDLVLKIYPTVEEALQALSPGAEEG
ncbi:MAG: STAS domain-containing protein [Desulfobacterales bacterium]|jgi:anti-anti-sigma factor